MGGGGFTINFPLVEGSTGWIKANDRDISLYLQSAYAESPPNTDRLHTFSDAVFFPDIMADYTINAEDLAANAVIQNAAGTVRISLWPAKVKIVAPNIETVGTLLHTGALTVVGNVVMTGTVTNNSKDIGSTHKHGGSPTAPLGPVSDTGVPT